MAITSFDVIQGNKATILFPIWSPYATSYLWITLIYILSRTVSKISWSTVQIFTVDRGVPLFTSLILGEHKFRTAKFGLHKLETAALWCEVYFNILNGSRVWQTDGQTVWKQMPRFTTLCDDQSNSWTTRNAFCGTWYLPHSHVHAHNERTVPIIMARCIAHARNGRISTSGEKSDVTIVFLDPDFLNDAQIWAIRP